MRESPRRLLRRNSSGSSQTPYLGFAASRGQSDWRVNRVPSPCFGSAQLPASLQTREFSDVFWSSCILPAAQEEALSSRRDRPLPVQEVPGLNIPGRGGENRAVRDGRDRFLRFLQRENNDAVS